MKCVAFYAKNESGPQPRSAERLVIATEMGILHLKRVVADGESYVFSEYDRATWRWPATGIPPVAQTLWSHRFFEQFEAWVDGKRLENQGFNGVDHNTVYETLNLGPWLDDRVPGGEEAWASFCQLVGLDKDAEIGEIITSARYKADDSYGMF